MESRFAAFEAAKQNLDRANINATGGTTSLASAQLKQALGNLKAAQANLDKTILRSPISGTINSLTVQSGDYISAFKNVAVVANNSALEIVTYVGDTERDNLNVGDKVLIENNYEGVITQIAPAVDGLTRKTEVRIATENSNIKNGDTVKITNHSDSQTTVKDIKVPLTAVKFEVEDGSIFVVREGKLESVAVKLGNISGNSVTVLEGLSANDEFVIDARGLLSGTQVEIKKLIMWEFFIKNNRFTYLILVALIGIGSYSLVAIPKESAPEVIIPVGIVTTTLLGAPAADIESLITNEIERGLTSLENVSKITSSSREGVSSVVVEFEASADLDGSIADLKDAIDRIKQDLPSDANDPFVSEVNFVDQPILTIAVALDISDSDFTTLSKKSRDSY